MNAIPPIDFPSLCEEMHVTERDGVPVVNSRYVATTFERRHDHVLRDIAEIKTSPTLGECLGTSWFLEQVSPDAYGRHQPSFDLTRQGLTILCMGWAGERALGFKVRYIQAFDAMEPMPATIWRPVSTIRRDCIRSCASLPNTTKRRWRFCTSFRLIWAFATTT
jgi:Rha family phage regulatory protein